MEAVDEPYTVISEQVVLGDFWLLTDVPAGHYTVEGAECFAGRNMRALNPLAAASPIEIQMTSR
jgi:hypothetical protein